MRNVLVWVERLSDSRRVSLIVGAAIAARVTTLWLGRPEFLGWLNHSYYYFVQVRGLMAEGALPYPDMPLLFFVYAALARALGSLGMETGSAIVASTRLVMTVVPALMPLVFYAIVRTMNRGEPVRGPQWALISVSGFLPLTLSHLPEFLQKNTAGLVLLALLVLLSQRALRGRRAESLVGAGLLIPAIVLTHFGTFAAATLWGLALFLAWASVRRDPRATLGAGLALASAAGFGVALLYLVDPRRFERLLWYAEESFDRSLVGSLLFGSPRPGLLGAALAVFALYVLFGFALGLYRRRSTGMATSDRVFWLASLLFCFLLVLPVLDEALMGRLANFLPVPLLVALFHVERRALSAARSRRLLAGVAAAGALVLAVGEVVGSRIGNRGHQEVSRDLVTLAAGDALGPDDLVITRTGAEHVVNWFFGVRAGVVTSLDRGDFETYRRVWVLNPLPASSGADEIEELRADDPAERYELMLSNVPRPHSIEPFLVTENLELFELSTPPAGWVFDAAGRFRSYRAPRVD